ncbi:hypothetical protein HY632_03685 [Candidatus Uhrbacteria bacterium]|nr:hypothetical protein [Candidatus Uhrbacteria bacterium]
MRTALLMLIAGAALDLTSIIGWGNSGVGTAFWVLLVLGIAAAAWHRLSWGVLIIFLELLWGSHGHLLHGTFGQVTFSLRMGTFLAVLSALPWHLRAPDARTTLWASVRAHPARLPAVMFFVSLIVALLLGMLWHPWGDVYRDANAWAFLALAPAILLGTAHKQDRILLERVLLWGAGYLILRTFLILFIFTHDLNGAWLPLYRWIRDTRLGEITWFAGGFPRIFLPSMALLFPVAFLSGYRALHAAIMRSAIPYAILSGSSVTVLVVSLSRSYWLALLILGAMGCGYGILMWRRTGITPVPAMRAAVLVGAVVGSMGIAAILAWMPYPQRLSSSGLSATLAKRLLTSQEPAIANRWQQLMPLRTAIARHAIFGNGFGATVTYTSKDPRTLAAFPDGQYTTSAVEWGYLDDGLERGVVGVLTELWVVFAVVGMAFRAGGAPAALGCGLLGIAVVHVVSPYLNHPLGIGALLLMAAVSSRAKTPAAERTASGLSERAMHGSSRIRA